MPNYTCTIKFKNPVSTFPNLGNKEMKVGISDFNMAYARKNLEFQYPDYKILNIQKESK